MEEYTPEVQESQSDQFKRWFQDNMRIIVSIAIVIVIAGGIYSYSKRGEAPATTDQNQATVTADKTASDSTTSNTQTAPTTDQKVATSGTSTETESSFVETAGKSDGLTVLARRATANYLEKNPDSTLTKEHKIYIEDYLRKNVAHSGGMKVGSSVEFSKDLVAKAIDQSKKLTAGQLKHLQRYSARVSSL